MNGTRSLAAEDSPSFAAGKHDVLNSFHRVPVLSSLKSSRVFAAQLAEVALEVVDRFVLMLLHPTTQASFQIAEMTDPVA